MTHQHRPTEAGNRHRIIHYVVIEVDNSSGRVIEANNSSGRLIEVDNYIMNYSVAVPGFRTTLQLCVDVLVASCGGFICLNAIYETPLK